MRRVIPTRVGTTREKYRRRWKSSGHPHACGDYRSSFAFSVASFGSSPRVWGLRRQGGGEPPPSWVIPTRVGTTSRPRRSPPSLTGHPHACGDYGYTPNPTPVDGGSSPRVWGLRGAGSGLWPLRRVIPTRVGTTLWSQ